MAVATLRDPRSGATLALLSRRILVAGVHGAPGIGVAIYGTPGGKPTDALVPGSPRLYRFFLTPAKGFPLLQDQFTIPAQRCRGGGLTIVVGDAPAVESQRPGDLTAFVPIPWPPGSVGYPDAEEPA